MLEEMLALNLQALATNNPHYLHYLHYLHYPSQDALPRT